VARARVAFDKIDHRSAGRRVTSQRDRNVSII